MIKKLLSAFVVVLVLTGFGVTTAKAGNCGSQGGCCSSMKNAGYNCDFKDVKLNKQHTASIRIKTDRNNMSEALSSAYKSINMYLSKNNVRAAGQPFAIYHEMNGQMVEFTAGIPTAKKIKSKDDIKAGKLPGGKALMATHFGSYDKLGDAHKELKQYLSDNGKKAKSDVWEVYVTDPGKEPDQSKWRTDLYVQVN